eukprot:1146356-Pelagomonas_calceolata.AAC.5
MEKNPYSIGYMDAGVGQSFTALVEVSLQNKAGKFLTSQESDVSAAALELFKSGWPSDPTDDFSGKHRTFVERAKLAASFATDACLQNLGTEKEERPIPVNSIYFVQGDTTFELLIGPLKGADRLPDGAKLSLRFVHCRCQPSQPAWRDNLSLQYVSVVCIYMSSMRKTPIAAMPMVFVRTDAVSMGATGARQRKAACLLWWPCDDFQGRGKLTLLLGLSCRPNWGKRTLPSP